MSKLPKLRDATADQPQLSSAYIRSLVSQLTSPQEKDSPSISTTDDNNKVGTILIGGDLGRCSLNRIGTNTTASTGPQRSHRLHQAAPYKRQVRRRLHTTRPFQERLLNMAEARREIMTALKFHRASMKQAKEQKQVQQQRSPLLLGEERNHFPRSQPASNTYPPWQVGPSTVASKKNGVESTDHGLWFALPNQTLGLNLNFQSFNNHLNVDSEITSYCPDQNQPVFAASSPSSSSSSLVSSSPTHTVTDDGVAHLTNTVAVAQENTCFPSTASTVGDNSDYSSAGSGFHLVLDDEEMAEIRSIGEQHQIEWSDTVNLVTSAWWLKFLHDMGDANSFDQVMMEFLSTSTANESSGFLQHLFSCCYASGSYQEDPDLPCMEIGEIDNLHDGWLA